VTVVDALEAIRRVGAVENSGGAIKVRLPDSLRPAFQSAIETLRAGKAEVIRLISGPESPDMVHARKVLNRAGVRILILETGPAIGIWSDLDGPEIRAALRTLGNAELAVRYLDGAGVPMDYRAPSIEGEPVPTEVLKEMERQTAEPWNIRDRMLKEIDISPKGKRA
jgi:hypothetical protein